MPKGDRYDIEIMRNEDQQQATCFQVYQCEIKYQIEQKHLKQFVKAESSNLCDLDGTNEEKPTEKTTF